MPKVVIIVPCSPPKAKQIKHGKQVVMPAKMTFGKLCEGQVLNPTSVKTQRSGGILKAPMPDTQLPMGLANPKEKCLRR